MKNEQKKALVTRFAKIEGHVRSIKNMTEEDRDLETIMQQIAAVKKSNGCSCESDLYRTNERTD